VCRLDARVNSTTVSAEDTLSVCEHQQEERLRKHNFPESTTFQKAQHYLLMILPLELPEALFNCLLQWLDLMDVGRLDSAICSTTERNLFLSTVRESYFVVCERFEELQVQDSEERLDLLLKWLILRRIATSKLIVTDYWGTSSSVRYTYLQRNGRHVHNVAIRKIIASASIIDAALAALFVTCSNIVELIFEGSFNAREHSRLLAVVAAHCHKLCVLHTSRSVVDADLIVLGEGCPHLRSLNWIHGRITNAGIVAIARNGALTMLFLDNCCAVTDEGLQVVAAHSPCLETVDISGCTLLTDGTLVAIGQHCNKLRGLDISYTHTTSEGLQAIAAGCTLLKELGAHGCNNLGPAVEAIARGCPRLQELDAPDSVITPAAMRALGECCPLLTALYIDGAEIGEQDICAVARGCPALRTLEAGHLPLTEDEVDRVRNRYKMLSIVQPAA
jgi:hypothetical protein